MPFYVHPGWRAGVLQLDDAVHRHLSARDQLHVSPWFFGRVMNFKGLVGGCLGAWVARTLGFGPCPGHLSVSGGRGGLGRG